MIGYLNICFICSKYSARPNVFADHLNYDKLRFLLNEMQVPVENKNWVEYK